MEEDLFADLYDGDETANDAKPSVAVASEPSAPSKSAVNPREEPGYGEEPDTAAPPASFEDYPGNQDDDYKEDNGTYDGADDKYQSTAPAARDEPLQMKEDG